jgi:Ca2+-binding EF-hand superfamily protein
MLQIHFRLISCLAGIALVSSLLACQNTNPPGTVDNTKLLINLAAGGLNDNEWQTEVSKLNQDYYDALDTNRDGNLTFEEVKVPFTSNEPESLDSLEPGLDSNKDGIWQASEYSRYMPEFIKRANDPTFMAKFIIPISTLKSTVNYIWQVTDDNKDGFLTVKDYLDSSKKTCPVGCDPVNTEKKGQEMVNQMDSDGDSKISYAEYQRAIIKNQREGMLVLLRKAQADRKAAAAPAAQASPAPAAPAG